MNIEGIKGKGLELKDKAVSTWKDGGKKGRAILAGIAATLCIVVILGGCLIFGGGINSKVIDVLNSNFASEQLFKGFKATEASMKPVPAEKVARSGSPMKDCYEGTVVLNTKSGKSVVVDVAAGKLGDSFIVCIRPDSCGKIAELFNDEGIGRKAYRWLRMHCEGMTKK